MSQDFDTTAPVSHMPMKALGLRTGMALQTRRLVEGASKKESQFFGAIESKGVMVGPLGPDGVKTDLEEGEICVVRGFTGQYEFSFLSKVLRIFQQPFAYALLAYPAQVDATKVRQSMRTPTSWPTSAQAVAKADAPETDWLTTTLVDLSMQGAMIKVDSALGGVGEMVNMCIEVDFDNTPTPLRLGANICHSSRSVADNTYFCGLVFTGLSHQDKLILNFATQPPPSL
jgi:hypothetical protein